MEQTPISNKEQLPTKPTPEKIRSGAHERMLALAFVGAAVKDTEFGTHKPTEEEIWDFGYELSENDELEQQFLRVSSRILALKDVMTGINELALVDDEWKAISDQENNREMAEISDEVRRLSKNGGLEKYLGAYQMLDKLYGQYRNLHEEYQATLRQKNENVYRSTAKKPGHKEGDPESGPSESVKTALLNRRRFLNKKIETLESELARFLGGDTPEGKTGGITEIKSLVRLDELTRLAQGLEAGRFVVTQDLEPTYDQVNMLMQNGQPVLLVGPHGSGKTELLRYCANQQAKEKQHSSQSENKENTPKSRHENNENYYIFSGSKESSVFDLVGKLKITTEELSTQEKLEAFTQDYRKMVESGVIHADHRLEEGTIEFMQMALQAYEGGKTKTYFSPGVLVRALKEGKPLIIDEIDQIPQEVLARINDILTRKVGDKVIIQENGEEEIEIAPGFLVVATGNIKSDKYDREKLDAAFASRFTTIDHQYLSKRDAYDVLLANFFDAKNKKIKTGINIQELSPKLIRLVVAMSETQDIFLGKYQTASLAAAKTENVNKKTSIKESPITIRSLMKVLKDFDSSDMATEDLDYSVGVGTLMIPNKEDKKAILEILLRCGFFEGWKAEDFYQQYNLDVDKDFLEIIRALSNEGGDQDNPYHKAISDAEQSLSLATSNKYL